MRTYEEIIEDEAERAAAELHDQGVDEEGIAHFLDRPRAWVDRALGFAFEAEREEIISYYGRAAASN